MDYKYTFLGYFCVVFTPYRISPRSSLSVHTGLEMAAAPNRGPYPRVPPAPQPDDVVLPNFSKRSVKNRAESGFYRGRDFTQVTNLSPARISMLDFYRDVRGNYLCPLCRPEEAEQFTSSYEDVKFSTTCLYNGITKMDNHVIAYHYPYVRYFACPAEDGYALSLIHISEPTRPY